MKATTQEEIFQLIGHISVFYSTLDMILATACHTLIPFGATERRSLRPNMTLGQRARLLEDLDPHTTINPDALLDFQKHIPEIVELAGLRNRFLHDQWLFSDKALKEGVMIAHRFEFTADGELRQSDTRFTVESFREVLNRVGRAQMLAGSFLGVICKIQ